MLVQGALTPGLAQAGCQAPTPSLDWSASHSRWDEVDAQGQRLLRETGTLQARGLALAMSCGEGWQLAAAFARESGTRAYTGQSSQGQPIRTHSDIDSNTLQASVLRRLSPVWQIGVQADWSELHRELASVGAVQGYAEVHRHAAMAVGVQAEPRAFGDLRWQGSLWLGAGPSGSVAVRLPNADPARLSTGSQRYVDAGFGLLSPLRPQGWQGRIGFAWRTARIDAGPTTTLWRGPMPVGSAKQPEQRLRDAALQAGLAYRF